MGFGFWVLSILGFWVLGFFLCILFWGGFSGFVCWVVVGFRAYRVWEWILPWLP